MIIGLGYYWLKRPDASAWLVLGIQLCRTVDSVYCSLLFSDWPFTWFLVPIWLLYALTDWSHEVKLYIRYKPFR